MTQNVKKKGHKVYNGAACRGQYTRFKTARTTVSLLMRKEILLKTGLCAN